MAIGDRHENSIFIDMWLYIILPGVEALVNHFLTVQTCVSCAAVQHPV